MKDTPRDYALLTAHAKNCGMIPYTGRDGKEREGYYTLEGLTAPVDLSACAEDEKSILRTALKQLSEEADESFHQMIEKDLQD